MKRIAIIGCGGSGKSSLARRMGATLNIAVRHLDSWYWKSEWSARSKDEWAVVHERLCSGSTWILDGNYGGTMDSRLRSADTVIFLDLPGWRCLWGAVRRYWQYRGEVRPELPGGCPERLTVEYIKWIWTYRRLRRPRILRRLEELESEKKVVILDSDRAVETFLVG
jgi:adenylate kinase family enzyme